MKRILLIALLVATGHGAALLFTVSPDSHLVVLNAARDTVWKSSTGGSGSTDSLMRGLWFLNAGTWAKNGQTLTIDSAAIHSQGATWGWGGGAAYDDSANAHNERQADSGHVYYFANAHGDSAWVYYIGAHGGHVWYLGDSAILSSTSYVGAKVLDSLVATRHLVAIAQGLAERDSVHNERDSVRLDGKQPSGSYGAPYDSAVVSASTHALPDSNPTVTVVNANRFRGALIGNVTGTADTAVAAGRATKIASNGDSAKVWGMTTPTTQGWIAGGGGTPDSVRVAGSAYRHIPRSVDTTSTATPTPNCDLIDQYDLTALAVGATFAVPAGSPINGQVLKFRIKDNGVARTLAWNATYTGTLPATTTPGTTLYVGFVYNSTPTACWQWLATR